MYAIQRKILSPASLAGVVLCISLFVKCSSPEKENQPNFIIIIDDQHNSKHMGWTGEGEGIKTPNIDRLAAESVAFTNAYSSCPVCAPARHSIYTGLYPSEHGVLLNDMELLKGTPTLMDLLAEAGYTTANVGKMHFGPYNARHGFQYVLNHEFFDNSGGISHFRPWLEREIKQRGIKAERYPQWIRTDPQSAWSLEVSSLGFEYDLPIDLTSEHWVTDRSIEFLEDQLNNRSDQPFLLHASYFAPHHPYGVVEEFNKYKAAEMKIPPSWSQEKAESFRREVYEKYKYPAFTREEYQEIKAYYFGFISQLDYEIGRLLDWVDSHPELASNTIVIFLSDHGDRMGEHGMLYKGQDGAMFEGSVGIPFMIRWPGQAPRKEKTPVTHLDIMPTLLNAAGVDPARDLPGMDLKQLLESEDTESGWQDRLIISEWIDPLPFGYFMARKGKYKFITSNRRGNFPELDYELYDMEEDKWEMNNLAYDPVYKPLVDELKQAVMDHFEHQKKFIPSKKPPIVPRNRWDIQFPFTPWEKIEALE